MDVEDIGKIDNLDLPLYEEIEVEKEVEKGFGTLIFRFLIVDFLKLLIRNVQFVNEKKLQNTMVDHGQMIG